MASQPINKNAAQEAAYPPISLQLTKSTRAKLAQAINTIALQAIRPFWYASELVVGSVILPLSAKAQNEWPSFLVEICARTVKIALGISLYIVSSPLTLLSKAVLYPLAKSLSPTPFMHMENDKAQENDITDKVMYWNVCMDPGYHPLQKAALSNSSARLDLIRKSIEKEKADLVVLTHLNPQSARSLFSGLKNDYKHCIYDMGPFVVLSKVKIESVRFVPFKKETQNDKPYTSDSVGFLILETPDEIVVSTELTSSVTSKESFKQETSSPFSPEMLARKIEMNQIKYSLEALKTQGKTLLLSGSLNFKNDTTEYLFNLSQKCTDLMKSSVSSIFSSEYDTVPVYSGNPAVSKGITDYIVEWSVEGSYPSLRKIDIAFSSLKNGEIASNHLPVIATLSLPEITGPHTPSSSYTAHTFPEFPTPTPSATNYPYHRPLSPQSTQPAESATENLAESGYDMCASIVDALRGHPS